MSVDCTATMWIFVLLYMYVHEAKSVFCKVQNGQKGKSEFYKLQTDRGGGFILILRLQ